MASRSEKDNYQDKFADAEFKKGEEAAREGKPKGGKPRGKGRRYDKYAIPDDILKKELKPINGIGGNDDSWHVPTQELVDETSAINMYNVSGRPVDLQPIAKKDSSSVITTVSGGLVNSPGIMVFEVFNGIGETNTSEDAYNVAGQLYFNYMQRFTGRTPNYDPANICMYNTAVLNAYGFYQCVTRVFGIMNDRNVQSDYIPRSLVMALGFDYDNLRGNMANFINIINQYALDLTNYPLPNNVTYNNWYLHQFENVYKDSDTQKAQLYAFKPAGFWMFVEGDETNPISYLNYAKVSEYATGTTDSNSSLKLLTYSDIITLMDDLLRPLALSGDIRMVKVDVLAVFGQNLFTVAQLANTYSIVPVYNSEISSVIENSYIYGVQLNSATITEPGSLHGGFCQQNAEFELINDHIWFRSGGKVSDFVGDPMELVETEKFLFNIHTDTPESNARNLTLTRYAGTGLSGLISAADDTKLLYSGARNNAYNMILNAEIYYLGGVTTSSSGKKVLQINMQSFNTQYLTPQTSAYFANDLYGLISKFDWHPSFRVIAIQAGSSVLVQISDYFVDLDNFATIDSTQLKNMNDVAMKGEFWPRDLGGYSPIK